MPGAPRPRPLLAQREFQFFAQFSDAAGRAVTTLTDADIQVRRTARNGKVLKLEPVDWPVRVAILLDNGTGSADRIVNVRQGAKGLIEALPAGVEISLQTLAPQPRWLVRPTTDKQALLEGVDRYTPGLVRQPLRGRPDRDRRPLRQGEGQQLSGGRDPGIADRRRQRDSRSGREAAVRAVGQHVRSPSMRFWPAPARFRRETAWPNASQIALAATKQTGGRYESIAAATRLATLLPEIGAQIAQSHARQSAQYRVTFERPAGKTGQIGNIGLCGPRRRHREADAGRADAVGRTVDRSWCGIGGGC